MVVLIDQISTGHGYRRRHDCKEDHVYSFLLDYNIEKDSTIEQLQFILQVKLVPLG